MAGYSKDATPATQGNRIATYFGQAANDWRDVLNNDEIDIYYVPALSRPFGPGRLAYHHKWGGGTYSIDSACATSTTAIHLACQALSSRECDTAIAGGGSLCVSPSTFAGLSKSGMISDNGGCRTFHDDADGYARGEGIGVVVLKRLEDAMADNDNVLGVIRGHARTYTTTSTSITHPSAESQARVYREVLRQTAMLPEEIAYVEMHGTGTQAGDLEEITSVIEVLGKQRSRSNVLTVGAVKANVGHGEGAAGVTSLIKVLMMLREKKIPPQPGLPFKINHNFPDLDALHVRIAGRGTKDVVLRPSPASRDGRIKCLISTFDATGGNTSLVVEEFASRLKSMEHPLKTHVVAVSAKTPTALHNNQKRLLDYLNRHPETALADVAYTTTARKMHEVLRASYTGSSIKDIVNKLRQDIMQQAQITSKKPKPHRLVFAFTGQGSQYTEMGRQLFLHNPDFAEMLRSYDQMCQHQGFPGFLNIIDGDHVKIDETSTVVVQLAIVALEIAIARLLKSWGVMPSLVIGHSLGEYAALCIAGVLSVSDTLYLVGRRAQLMEERLVPGQYAMLAVAKSLKATMHLLAAEINSLRQTQVACINAPESTVVSGPVSEIKHLQAVLAQQNSKATLLRTPYGFHSHHIDTILGDFEAVAQAIHFAAPKIPIASSLLGKVVDAGDRSVFSSDYLVRQARDCVDFTGAVQAYQNHPLARSQTVWIEIGPEPMSVSLARRTLAESSDQFAFTMKVNENNWTSVSNLLAMLYRAGVSINWARYHKHFSGSLSLLRLPSYAFDEKNYWKTYVERSSAGHVLAPAGELPAAQASQNPIFSTTSLQSIEREDDDGKTMTVMFASHTSEPKLFDAIQGHVVNGSAIVSMSIFCDMAKSAARYVYEKANSKQAMPSITIRDVDMTHALSVASKDPTQVIRTTISYSRSDVATVRFSSLNGAAVSMDHGSICVVFEDVRSWFAEQAQTSFLVDARVASLKEMSSKGMAHRLMKSVAYRLFDGLVAYGANYKAMEEVWIDSECRDAAATVQLPRVAAEAGKFLYNPFWSDGAVHLGGFLLNSGLKYPEDVGCLCTGLGSWHVLEELQVDETYTTYTAVQDSTTPNMLTGSAYIYDSHQKLVQVITGLRFHKMKKATMTAILGSRPSHAPIKAASPPEVIQPSQWSSSIEAIDFGATMTATPSQDGSEHGNIGKDSGYATPEQSIKPDTFATFLSIVASECGCSEAELDPSTVWSDVGLDSLMAITIIAIFRKRVGVELPVTFFLDHQTVATAKEALLGPSSAEDSPSQPSIDTRFQGLPSRQHAVENATTTVETACEPTVLSPTLDAEDGDIWVDAQQDVVNSKPVTPPEEVFVEIARPSQAVLLHGSPNSDGPKLFLLPDGSGSPSSYIGLPSLSPTLNIYAIQSPFVKHPSEFTCNVKTICDSFLDAIKTIQPSGPYLLGGFSFGALYAYEVMRSLLDQGQVIDQLVLIDMAVLKPPNPRISVTPPMLIEAGLLPTTGPLTAASKEHYLSTVRAMVSYNPQACLSAGPRKTLLLTSTDGLASSKSSELACWAHGDESALRGWDDLIPTAISRKHLDGAHFRLLKYPNVS